MEAYNSSVQMLEICLQDSISEKDLNATFLTHVQVYASKKQVTFEAQNDFHKKKLAHTLFCQHFHENCSQNAC